MKGIPQEKKLTAKDLLMIYQEFHCEIARAVARACEYISEPFPLSGAKECRFLFNSNQYTITVYRNSPGYDGWKNSGQDGNYGLGLWLWMTRKGQLWEKDIEAHVTNHLDHEGGTRHLKSYIEIKQSLDEVQQLDALSNGKQINAK